MAIPSGLFATMLNKTERRIDRHDVRSDKIPYVHVSTLINTSLYDTFCPREFALKYHERTPAAGGSVPPKFEVMYETGSILGEKAVEKFLRRSAEYRQYAWGDWVCKCKHTRVILDYKPKDMVCNRCRGPVEHYAESDIRSEKIHAVGHADFLMRDDDGTIYVYEIKSIDRTGVNFDELTEPFGDHVLQASLYYWMLISLGYKVHKHVRIVYIDRSLSEIYRTHPYKEMSALRVSAKRVKVLSNKSRAAYSACKSGILPPRICESIEDSRAQKCKVAVSCFSRRLKTAKRMPSA